MARRSVPIVLNMPSTKRSAAERESVSVRATKRARLSSPTSSLKENEFLWLYFILTTVGAWVVSAMNKGFCGTAKASSEPNFNSKLGKVKSRHEWFATSLASGVDEIIRVALFAEWEGGTHGIRIALGA
ncbi:hypothetical protein NMY22_g11588 [Coprinellus aureogranulatus]|nr:hypothetical protein NMY22_g11588 [Coprinellus aureogranulatus]